MRKSRCYMFVLCLMCILDFGYSAISPPTYLFGAAAGEGKIYLGWRLDKGNPGIGYNVYRKGPGDKEFVKKTPKPITGSTNYLDNRNIVSGQAYQYEVRAVIPGSNKETEPARVTVKAGSRANNIYRNINFISPDTTRGGCKVGDIDGDGQPDFLVVSRKGNKGNLHARVFFNNGQKACDIDMGETELKSRTAWTFWDLDNDGKDELIGVMKKNPGDKKDTQYTMYVMDPTYQAAPGYKILSWIDVPSTKPATTRYKTIGIAYLDGQRPYILYASGHQVQDMDVLAYTYENKPALIPHWHYHKKLGTKDIASSHQFEVADIDGDGKDEAFFGSYLFNRKGFIGFWGGHEWSHADLVKVRRVRANSRKPDVGFWLEQSGLSFHLTDNTGKEVWRRKDCPGSSHAHAGWIGNVVEDSPGMEVWVFFKNPANKTSCSVLYSSNGNKLFEGDGRTDNLGYGTVDWDGAPPLEIVRGSSIVKFMTDARKNLRLVPVKPAQNLGSSDKMTMDVVGDYREEVVSFDRFKGALRMQVYTNITLNESRRPSPCQDRYYLAEHRWAGH